MEQGFYKYENSLLMYVRDSVGNRQFTLKAELKDTYTYPVYGWYWFDSFAKAALFFNIDTTGMTDEQKADFTRLKMLKIGEIVKTYILENELTQDEINVLTDLCADYEVGKAYIKDELFKYDGKLYRVLQAHTSQADWLPDVEEALYVKVQPAGVFPEWNYDDWMSYTVGVRVSRNGKIYECINASFGWIDPASPDGHYGWKEV